jgi:hypothetical protein
MRWIGPGKEGYVLAVAKDVGDKEQPYFAFAVGVQSVAYMYERVPLDGDGVVRDPWA